MLCLVLDTALGACQAALIAPFQRPATVVLRSVPMERGGSEHLVALVDDVLAAGSVAYRDIDRVVVTTGPGSFTGIRTALAYARGLGIVLHVPVVGVTTLEAFAAGLAQGDPAAASTPIGAVVGARHGAVYGQHFTRDGGAASQPAFTTIAAFVQSLPSPVTIVGDAAEPVAEAARAAGRTVTASVPIAAPDVRAVASIGACRQPHGRPAPIYLKPADAAPSAQPAIARI